MTDQVEARPDLASAPTPPRLGYLRALLRYQYAPIAVLLGLVAAGQMGAHELHDALRVMWRPLLAITSIMVVTVSAERLGVLARVAAGLFPVARGSAKRLFGLVFVMSAGTAAILNNDSAVLLIVPIVVVLVRHLYPSQPRVVVAFAFVVFMAAGVAPFVVSNPMNMIVAEYAGISFNGYALTMIPVALAGWAVAFVALRLIFRRDLELAGTASVRHPDPPAWAPPEWQGLLLLLVAVGGYPVVASLGLPLWVVASPAALGALALCARHGVGRPREVLREGVAWDILVFLAGVSAVAIGLDRLGVVDGLSSLYDSVGAAGIGAISAVGSALLNNHPMSLLNILAIDPAPHRNTQQILAALVGGDLGPRLLPWGSLAGLLWFASLRRLHVEVSVIQFARVGALVTLATLPVSLALLLLV